MKNRAIYIISIFISVVSCNYRVPARPGQWDGEKLNTWFEKGKWRSGWQVSPDGSIDKKEFALQYFQNKERWDKAFAFLANNNLPDMPLGRYDLDGDNVYAIISGYQSKNRENCRFEAHRKYADIQYLVAGEEQIGLAALENATATTPYNSEKDIVFLEAKQDSFRIASPETFFIFFPKDAHCPGAKITGPVNVKKVVVKVLLE